MACFWAHRDLGRAFTHLTSWVWVCCRFSALWKLNTHTQTETQAHTHTHAQTHNTQFHSAVQLLAYWQPPGQLPLPESTGKFNSLGYFSRPPAVWAEPRSVWGGKRKQMGQMILLQLILQGTTREIGIIFSLTMKRTSNSKGNCFVSPNRKCPLGQFRDWLEILLLLPPCFLGIQDQSILSGMAFTMLFQVPYCFDQLWRFGVLTGLMGSRISPC